MTFLPSTTPLPATIFSAMAFEAFDHVIQTTDWRLRIATLDPIALTVESDHAFDLFLSRETSWQTRHQAEAWITRRITEIAMSIDKSCLRRLHLQHPASIDEPYAEAFLDGIQVRIREAVRAELVDHFDTSIQHWEAEARTYASTTETVVAGRCFAAFTGLDQVVSDDAIRKAIRYLFHRAYWHLRSHDDAPLELCPDTRFSFNRTLRHSRDETTRARSLVARCVEVLFNDYSTRVAAGENVALVTRRAMEDELKWHVERDGSWGLVHMVMMTDRERFGLEEPDLLNEEAWALIRRQHPWLHIPLARRGW